jgi:DNA-binding NarL/FixJ family response regulator
MKMSKDLSMLQVKEADIEAVVRFLKSELLDDSRVRATHACVLLLLPIREAPPLHAALSSADVNAATFSCSLTQRELSVLKGVTNGLSNAQIARELNSTVGSIKGAVQTLFRKLGVRPKRRSALVRAALAGPPTPSPEISRDLTQIESAVFEGVKQRWTNREIARSLQIPEIAVKAAIRTLCARAGVRNRTQLPAAKPQVERSSQTIASP